MVDTPPITPQDRLEEKVKNTMQDVQRGHGLSINIKEFIENGIDPNQFFHLLEKQLKSNASRLGDIFLSYVELDEKGTIALAGIISSCANLSSIYIDYTEPAGETEKKPSSQPVTDETQHLFWDSIVSRKALSTLILSNADFRNEGGLRLQQLSQLPNLKRLDIGDSGLKDADCTSLKQAKHTPTITTINLNNNDFTAEGLQILAPYFAAGGHLESASLATPNAGKHAAPLFAEVLRQSPRLEYFDVSGSNLGYEGAMIVAKAAAEHSLLWGIAFSHNGLSQTEMDNTVKALTHNNTRFTLVFCEQEGAANLSEGTIDLNQQPNLLHVAGMFEWNNPYLKKNDEEVKRLQKLVKKTSDYAKTDLHFIYDLERRASAIFHDHDLKQYRNGFDAFLSALPGVPATREGWRTANDTGFAPVDNPRVWRDPGLGGALAQVDFTPDFLDTPSAKGMTFRMGAALGLSGGDFIQLMNGHGLRIGAAELLDGDGQPNELFQEMIDEGKAPALFAPHNLMGAQPGEMRKLMDCLPQDQQQRADTHQYRALLNRSAPAQTTNAARGR